MDVIISEVRAPVVPQAVAGKGFGIRAGAYIIDTIIIMAINLATTIVVMMFISAMVSGRMAEVSEEENRFLDLIVGFTLRIIYFTIFEWLYGASPGKLMLNMRVVMEDGSPCSFQAALHRGVLRLIDGLFFGLVGYFSMKEPLYQRIGDQRAKTIVVGSNDAIIQQPWEWWWLLIAAGLYLVIQTFVSIFIAAWLFR
jgi:uncharacterized RDD family membrane protein YckC